MIADTLSKYFNKPLKEQKVDKRVYFAIKMCYNSYTIYSKVKQTRRYMPLCLFLSVKVQQI